MKADGAQQPEETIIDLPGGLETRTTGDPGLEKVAGDLGAWAHFSLTPPTRRQPSVPLTRNASSQFTWAWNTLTPGENSFLNRPPGRPCETASTKNDS